ncbi:MAG: serine hydrolase [Nannocystis sp.]|uniref:serine hydrolase domain-containing protein n=1 Tax=Nannocystis sp. TaxID=1962667 RepID=UPI002429D4F6|nr:serine hydrolase [Nannocystis sp.]MBK9754030.1 serine hydrolase [Nannocystis sp.]
MTSKGRGRLWRRALAVLALLLLAAGVFVTGWILPTATGYVARNTCSAVLLAGRDPAQVAAEDMAPYPFVSTTVDREQQLVRATVVGLAARTAVYRPGLGCALAIASDSDTLRAQGFEPPRAPASAAPWPQGDGDSTDPDPPGLDRAGLDAAVAAAFSEPDPESLRRTRAVIVVYDGAIVAERHADGFDRNTLHLGWSMSKSVTNALVGILVGRGQLDLQAPAPVPAWADDPRRAITLDQLLRMSSGLEFDERYGALADATHMLFEVDDAAAYAISKPLAHPPDTVFSYSSATTNILSWIVRQQFTSDAAYHRYPHEALFAPIGMRSAVFETDATGTLLGSSYVHASARDWARFGLLYLQDGVWNGARVLPPGWVDYSRTPTPTSETRDYAAQFWANAGKPDDPGDRRFPHLPVDAYQASGFQGQAVLIVPSRRAVIVRLGMTHQRPAWDLDAFAASVLAALPADRS